MPSPLLTLSRAAHTFPSGTRALQPINLAVVDGDFTSIVGPSGCGKSTLLRMAAGLLRPSEGEVSRSFEGLPGDVAFVFQDATLMPWATALKNVRLPLDLAHVAAFDAEARAREALARVGLAEFAGAYPRELSGGMRMRVSIARAIVTNPRLLLMDEPFAALDEFTRFQLNEDLLQLWQANRWTILFVTHSVREAVFLSERVVVMTPRPGMIAADLRIELPSPRNEALRLSHAFADECARVTTVLGRAIPTKGQAT